MRLRKVKACTVYYLMYPLLVALSLATGMLLTALKGDLGGGFTVSSYMATVDFPSLVILQMRHQKRCSCDAGNVLEVIGLRDLE